MTLLLMKVLLFEYFVLGVSSVIEGKWMLALYWFGAFTLNISVYVMNKS